MELERFSRLRVRLLPQQAFVSHGLPGSTEKKKILSEPKLRQGHETVAALVELIKRLLGTTTGDSTASTITANPSTTATATSTPSSSSTTTCTETSTPTPIIIVTKYGTSDSEYDDLVRGLPKTADPQQFRGIEIGNWWILATLDQCTSEALWKNPIVEAMAIDQAIVLAENDDPKILDDDSQTPRLKEEMKKESSSSPGLLIERQLERRDLPDTSHLLEQTNSPDHLKWISGLSRQTGLTGPFYDFENYVYDDQARSTLQFQPFVYVLDHGGFVEHEVRYFGRGLNAGHPYYLPTYLST